jgi:polyhydroxybutyrate depolymerase
MMRILTIALTLHALCAIASADASRRHTLYVPRSAPATGKLPVIVVLSCYGCSSAQPVVDLMHLDELADRHGVMLLLPEARVDKRGHRFWSATDACCNFDGAPDDDVAFIAHLLDGLVANGRADPARIYLAGWSNGGFFVYRLACELSPRIAAIVSVAGAGFADASRCHATNPVAVLEVHGDADHVVPYAGGTLPSDIGGNRARLPGARATVAEWARRNGCRGDLVSGGDADLDSSLKGRETRIESYRGCRRPVELWTVTGADHGFFFTPVFAERVWQFLSQHALEQN